MDTKQMAIEILENVGGKENVSNVTHCATRLRISVNEVKLVDVSKLDAIQDVLKVIIVGNQVQVVIGNQVNNVYKEFVKLTGEPTKKSEEVVEKKGNVFSRFFDLLSGSLTPLVPVFAGAGMLKSLLILLMMFGLISDTSGFYHVIAAAGNAVFYFFPIMLGFTVAQKLNVNPFIGATIGASLLEPTFTALVTDGTSVNFLGIPMVPLDYSGSMLPIFIAIIVYSYLERFLQKHLPSSLQIFLVPMISIGIIVPFTVLVFGPFGLYVSQLIGTGINTLIGFNTILGGALISGLWVFIVSLGLHWALMPIAIQNLTVNGSDQILAMAAGCVFAGLGIALGVFLKTKDKDLKAFSLTSAAGQFLAGVGEPIMYGIIFRYKKLIPIGLIVGGISGALLGFFDVKLIAFTAFTNIFTIASFTPILPTIFVWIVTVVIAIALIMVFGFEDEETEVSAKQNEISISDSAKIISPLSGEVQELSEVNDSIFSSGVMGKGIAIIPDGKDVVAPFDGEVVMITETKHAIGLKSDSGVELLIHIGIDTFKLDGKPFDWRVNTGDKFKTGDYLGSFDKEMITSENLDPTVIIVVTNSDEFKDLSVSQSNETNINQNDYLFDIE